MAHRPTPDRGWLRSVMACRFFVALLALVLAPALRPGALAAAEKPDPSGTATVDQLVARADDLMKKGSIFEAITALSQAVELSPDRSDLRLRLAGLMKQRGIWIRSAEQYRAVLAADPGSVPARLGYAELLLAEYQFRAAAEEFRKVLETQVPLPERDRALVGLGSAQFGMESYREAIDTYRLLLARRPDEPSALAFTNIALRKIGDLDGAIEGWKRFLEKQPGTARAKIHLTELEELRSRITRQKQAAAADPGNATTQRRLGELLMRQPDLDGAIAAFRAAKQADPADAATGFRLGIALRDSGRHDQGATVFRTLTSDREWGVLAAYNIAYCAVRTGESALEVSAWRRALEGNARDAYAYRRLLGALRRGGGGDEELDLLLTAIKDRPADPLPRIQYAVLSSHVGREEEGMKALLDALTIEPNDPYALNELRSAMALRPGAAEKLIGEIETWAARGTDPVATAVRKGVVLLAAGRPGDAEARFAEGAARRPTDARIAVAIALCRRAAGATPDATVEVLRKAKDLDPDYLYAHLDLAMTLRSMALYDEAVSEAESALRISPDNPVALTIAGAALRDRAGDGDLDRSHSALRRAVQIDPMDMTGAARFLLAKVAWELDREEEARATLRGDLPVEPEEMYSLAWEYVRDNYKDRTFNGQDWNSWKDRFTGKIATRADALAAIAEMLASLDDRDTRLRSADQTAGLFFTPRATRIQRDSMGRTAVGSKTVEASTLEGNVGYLAVTNMTDPKLVNEVRSAVGEMKERDGVILDLRGNPGGSENDTQAITSMLVRSGVPTGSVITPAGTQPVSSRGGGDPLISDKPVVVLVDRNTASSAEALAGALKDSHRAVIVGEHTYGKAGVQLPRLLPDGTIVLVASAENADLSGKPYTGVGVAPDVAMEGAMPSGDPLRDAAIQKAREILTKEQARRRRAPGEASKP